MNRRNLLESIRNIVDPVLEEATDSKGRDAYSSAKKFFAKSVLPDGSKWGKPVNLRFEVVNDPKIKKMKTRDKDDGSIEYLGSVTFSPGKGGGGGMTIDAAASNQLFNMLGTDGKTIGSVSGAFSSFVKGSGRRLNDEIRRWFLDKNNFVHQIVGWSDKDNYKIDDVKFSSIKYGSPMVDPTRRKWPAGRTEIWQPVVASVIIKLRRK